MLIDQTTVQNSALAGLRLAESVQFTSSDPYDGLSAPMAKFLKSRLSRQLWLQLIKRSGDAPRRLLGIPPVKMAKALALFSMAAMDLGEEDLANGLVDDLLRPGSGPWGYEFDVQTRWAFYAQGTPNVVATTFAIRAIDHAGRIDEVPKSVGDWLTSLYDARGYFAYTKASDTLIHNGSLLAAESLGRLGRNPGLVQQAIDTTLRHQRADGGWSYGDGQGLDWEDSFHTIYVIDSLTELASRGYNVGDSVAKALGHWRSSFFTASGEPTYYSHDKRPSNDIHNLATVVGAIADYGHIEEIKGLAPAATRRLLQTQDSEGAFRRTPSGPLYLRWNQGHAVLALAKLTKRGSLEHI